MNASRAWLPLLLWRTWTAQQQNLPPAYLWQGQRGIYSHLFLQGGDWLDCLEERISHDDRQAAREGSVTPPRLFSLLCPCPVKQGLTQEAVCGVERLYAKCYPGTEYSWYQFKSSQNCGKFSEGTDMVEFSLSPPYNPPFFVVCLGFFFLLPGRKGPQGCAPFNL